MRLSSLTLEYFRSYEHLDFAFGEHPMQLLMGQNGAGKTNIVEAVSFLSQGRSCLGVKPDDVIRFQKGHFRVRAETVSDAGSKGTMEVVFQQVPTRATACFLDDVRVPFSGFIGKLPAVCFLPQDLGIFTGPPSHRRAFLDNLLIQLDPQYLSIRMRMERTLKQRNTLLKRIDAGEASPADLDPWDDEFASAGAGVQQARRTLSRSIGERFPSMFLCLGERWNKVELSYIRTIGGEDEVSVRATILALLRERRGKDIPAGSTTAGPHRDDWDVLLDGRSMGAVASRGQQRSGFITLLFIAVQLLIERQGEKPVIVLDDVLSELDEQHQKALLEQFHECQTIVTTTHLIPGLETGDRWEVGTGTIGLLAIGN